MNQKTINRVFVAVVLILIALIIFKKPSQVFQVKPVKTYTKEIIKLKEKEGAIENKVITTKKELTYYKTIFDTTNIVLYQDSVIMYQDTQIVTLKNIVTVQDTLITVLKHDNKRLKRQRNLLIGATGILGAIAIIK